MTQHQPLVYFTRASRTRPIPVWLALTAITPFQGHPHTRTHTNTHIHKHFLRVSHTDSNNGVSHTGNSNGVSHTGGNNGVSHTGSSNGVSYTCSGNLTIGIKTLRDDCEAGNMGKQSEQPAYT